MSKRSRTEPARWRAPSKNRWQIEDGRGLVAAWRASGQSMARFAREHRMSTRRIVYWRERVEATKAAPRRGESRTPPRSGFAAVRVIEDAETTVLRREPWRLELTLIGGRRVAVIGPWDRATIRLWLGALEETA